MRIKIIILFAITIGFMYSCDTIEGDYIEIPEVADTSVTVTMFEFTGTQCIYCPGGHEELDKLKGYYGDKLQIIGVHAGTFAEPNSEFPSDFRSEPGDVLFEQINPTGYPAGTVNTLNGPATGKTEWITDISSELEKSAVADISVSVNNNGTTLSVGIDIEFLEAISEEVFVCAYVVEDHLISKQKEYIPEEFRTEIHEEYEQKHVLRASFNGDLGENIAISPAVGTKFDKQYSLNINNDWNADNLEVVVFLYNYETKNFIPSYINYSH